MGHRPRVWPADSGLLPRSALPGCSRASVSGRAACMLCWCQQSSEIGSARLCPICVWCTSPGLGPPVCVSLSLELSHTLTHTCIPSVWGVPHQGWDHPGGEQIRLFGGNDVSVQVLFLCACAVVRRGGREARVREKDAGFYSESSRIPTHSFTPFTPFARKNSVMCVAGKNSVVRFRHIPRSVRVVATGLEVRALPTASPQLARAVRARAGVGVGNPRTACAGNARIARRQRALSSELLQRRCGFLKIRD